MKELESKRKSRRAVRPVRVQNPRGHAQGNQKIVPGFVEQIGF